jgi:hypothetical protein
MFPYYIFKLLAAWSTKHAKDLRDSADPGVCPADITVTITDRATGMAVEYDIAGTVKVSDDQTRPSKRIPWQSVAVELAAKVNDDTRALVIRRIFVDGHRPTVKAACGDIQDMFATFDTEPQVISGNVRVEGVKAEHVATVDTRASLSSRDAS